MGNSLNIGGGINLTRDTQDARNVQRVAHEGRGTAGFSSLPTKYGRRASSAAWWRPARCCSPATSARSFGSGVRLIPGVSRPLRFTAVITHRRRHCESVGTTCTSPRPLYVGPSVVFGVGDNPNGLGFPILM